MKHKKIIYIIIVIFLLIVTFQIGKFFGEMKYDVMLARCLNSEIPYEDYNTWEASSLMNKMLQNFYGQQYHFTKQYTPKNLTAEELHNSFNNGGYHYFETKEGVIMECGIYK
ncbi:MAG: hypothetical protein U5L10_03855 [Candidatus Moranbacteria bacterium]|nr:hypothetical protein [Candidatus Moranbacteria bacterium]